MRLSWRAVTRTTKRFLCKRSTTWVINPLSRPIAAASFPGVAPEGDSIHRKTTVASIIVKPSFRKCLLRLVCSRNPVWSSVSKTRSPRRSAWFGRDRLTKPDEELSFLRTSTELSDRKERGISTPCTSLSPDLDQSSGMTEVTIQCDERSPARESFIRPRGTRSVGVNSRSVRSGSRVRRSRRAASRSGCR